MPLMKLLVCTPVPAEKKEKLLLASSKIIARLTGKPEGYVMVTIEHGVGSMAGKTAPAVFADVRAIGGLSGKVNAQISEEICDLLRQELDIKPENVYLNFTEVAAQNWGWKGGTFG